MNQPPPMLLAGRLKASGRRRIERPESGQVAAGGSIVCRMIRRVSQLACFLLLVLCLAACKRSGSSNQSSSDQFLSLMNVGKNYLDQGDATNALAIYKKAQAIVPNDPDVHLNLANAYLVAGVALEAIREADEV